MDLLAKTIEKNPDLISAATVLHQSGEIPADTYVIDLDMVRSNAERLHREATKNGLKSYICAKQFGRNPLVCKAIMNSGIQDAMAHDIEGAKNLHRHGIPVKHLGHFGQVPTSELRYVLEKIKPDVITVFSVEKAKQISEMALKLQVHQGLLLKIIDDPRLELLMVGGGFTEDEAMNAAKQIQNMKNVKVTGTTAYPAFSFNISRKTYRTSPNFEAMMRLAQRLENELGFKLDQINAAGQNCVENMSLAAQNGATHVEPGQSFIGTLASFALLDNPAELPAIVYVTEISHFFSGHALAYGDSYMTTVGFGSVKNDIMYEYVSACVGDDPEELIKNVVPARPQHLPHSDQGWFLYCCLIPDKDTHVRVGDTAVLSFRPQIFRTPKGRVAVIDGIHRGKPRLLGLFDRSGVQIDREDDGPLGYDRSKTIELMNQIQ
jgi:predicted amino acid racemase